VRSDDDRRNNAGRQEGEESEQADASFALRLTPGDLDEGTNASEPDIVIHHPRAFVALPLRSGVQHGYR
jgi:hypothetical protein